jgi:hypothetical protein
MGQLATAALRTFVVTDYPQLLDQMRENPELSEQIRALKSSQGQVAAVRFGHLLALCR